MPCVGALERRWVSINLHRFRRAAATFWSVQDPTNVRGVKDLLGHASISPPRRSTTSWRNPGLPAGLWRE